MCYSIAKREQNGLTVLNGGSRRGLRGDGRSRISCCAGSFVCRFVGLDQEFKTGIVENLDEIGPSF